MITPAQILSRRAYLLRLRRNLVYPIVTARYSGDRDEEADLLAEWRRLGMMVLILDNWLIELRGAAAVAEAERILDSNY